MRCCFAQHLVTLITIACSISVMACASSTTSPPKALYAPAELVQPFVPEATEPQPAQAGPITLDALLVYADAHAPVIRTAQAKAGLAKAQEVDAEILFPANPQLSVSAGTRTLTNTLGFEFEASIQQQLEIAGEVQARRLAAQDQKKLAEAVVNHVRWSVHVEVHRLFVNLLLAKERLRQAKRFITFSEAMRTIAARQVEAGESSPLILLVADADLAQTQEAVMQARLLVSTLRTRLTAVVGWPQPSLPTLEGKLTKIQAAPKVELLLEQMQQQHPILRWRELDVVAKHSKRTLEDREAWPKPTLGLSYSQEAADRPEETANIWLLSLSAPIPMWRTNQGARARAEANLYVADRQREETMIQLKSQLIQASNALNTAAQRVLLYEQDVVPQLEQNLVLLQRAYELGEVDVHQVSQTRARLLRATSQYLDARVTYHQTAATLEGLVGTEIWNKAEDSP